MTVVGGGQVLRHERSWRFGLVKLKQGERDGRGEEVQTSGEVDGAEQEG